MSRFQMQEWTCATPGDRSTRYWKPMEKGAAPKVWRPRATLAEAVEKCREWAGLGDVCIPTMQVVDLQTGLVEWRSGSYEDEVTPSVAAVCEWCGGELTVGTCPRSLPCPTCAAEPGSPCRRPSGHEADVLHAARVELAESDLPPSLRGRTSRPLPREADENDVQLALDVG